MLYLAFKIIKSKDSKNQDKNEDINLYLTGMLMQFVNPKVILYGITVVSNFIIPTYKSNISLFSFSILLASVAVISTLCWALFGTILNKFLSKYRKEFNVVMGILLIYSAYSLFR